VPELGSEFPLMEMLQTGRIIFWPTPFELPHLLGQRASTPGHHQPGQRAGLHGVGMTRQHSVATLAVPVQAGLAGEGVW